MRQAASGSTRSCVPKYRISHDLLSFLRTCYIAELCTCMVSRNILVFQLCYARNTGDVVPEGGGRHVSAKSDENTRLLPSCWRNTLHVCSSLRYYICCWILNKNESMLHQNLYFAFWCLLRSSSVSLRHRQCCFIYKDRLHKLLKFNQIILAFKNFFFVASLNGRHVWKCL
jgi:hypothetical protein